MLGKKNKMDLRNTKAATVAAPPSMADEGILLDEEQQPWAEKLGLDLTSQQWVKLVLRVVFLAGGVMGLQFYEKHNIKTLKARQGVLETELADLKTDKDKLTKELDSFGFLSEQSDKLYSDSDTMKLIANERLLAVKGLDKIRSVIPKKVWIRSIRYNQKKFIIRGSGVSSEEIEHFVNKLENTRLFAQVSLNDMRDQKASPSAGGFNRKAFTVESILHK